LDWQDGDGGTDPGDLPAEKTSITGAPAEPSARKRDVIPISSAAKQLKALKSLTIEKEAPRKASSGSGSQKLPWVLLVLVVIGFGVYNFNLLNLQGRFPKVLPTASPKPEATRVRVETVHMGRGAGQRLMAAGWVAARTPITVGVTSGGRIKSILVENGDKVKRNQVLAQLDDGPARAEMSLAVTKKHDAERILARMKKLKEAQAVLQTDVDRALGAAEIARAELRPIQQRIEQARIRASIDGTILEVLAHPGEVIAGNGGVVKLADLTKLSAEVDVGEADLQKVRRNQKVSVSSEAADRTYAGTVDEIADQADRARGTVAVKIHLQIQDQSLRPGMNVKVSFLDEPETNPRIMVPKSAVTQNTVWVVGPDGTVAQRKLTTQSAGPTLYEVVDGLKDGEQIVVEGGETLQPGQKIQ
jgi:RND family efflux transporter MFP subunit